MPDYDGIYAGLPASEDAMAVAEAVYARAEDTMRLFAAAMIAQRPHDHSFPIERYLKTTC